MLAKIGANAGRLLAFAAAALSRRSFDACLDTKRKWLSRDSPAALLLAAGQCARAPMRPTRRPSRRSSRRWQWPTSWPPRRLRRGGALADEHTLYMELPAGRVIIELEPCARTAHGREHRGDGATALLRRVGGPAACRTTTSRSGAIPMASARCPAELQVARAGIRRAAGQHAVHAAWPMLTAMRRRRASSTAFRPRAMRTPGSPGSRTAMRRSGRRPRHRSGQRATAANCTRSSATRRGISIAMSRWSVACARGSNCSPACRAARRTWAFTPRLGSAPRSSRCAWRARCRRRLAPRLEVLRTDTPAFAALVASRRNRHDDWFVRPCRTTSTCATCRCPCGRSILRTRP
jgi:hypothetical protein